MEIISMMSFKIIGNSFSLIISNKNLRLITTLICKLNNKNSLIINQDTKDIIVVQKIPTYIENYNSKEIVMINISILNKKRHLLLKFLKNSYNKEENNMNQ